MQQAEASSQMLSSCAEAERALAFAFEDAPDAYAIPQADHDRVNGGSGQAIGQATYGELLPRGVSMLIHALRLDEQSIFYDLGSGRGNVVLQAALSSRAMSCRGVELSERRHEIALHALARLGPRLSANVRFACEDLDNASWDDATEVFAANLLFPTELDAALCRRLAGCDALRRVATLKPLTTVPRGFTLACRLKLPFTWAEKCSVFIYSRRRSHSFLL